MSQLLTNKYLLIGLGLVAIVGLVYIGYTASQNSVTVPTAPSSKIFQPKTATLPPTIKDQAVSGQIIVKFNPQYSDAQINEHLQQYHASIIKTIEGINQKVVKVPAGQEKALIQQLQNDGYAQTAQQDYTTHAFFVPDDPGYTFQYAFDNIGQSILGKKGTANADIHIENAWDVTEGNGVKVAILDTGINLNHPDLAGKIVLEKSFVSNNVEDGFGHGTHVAGIIAADTNNNAGVAGTCPGCQLIIGKVLDDTGSGTTSNATAGITWAADNGAKVINMSLGTTDPNTASLYAQAVNYAMSKGAVVVAAAGNEGNNQPNYPAGAPGVISVAATTNNDGKASFSNFGSYVEIAAPGDNILSTAPDHVFVLQPSGYIFSSPYMYLSGTSMATPYVAGVAALIASTPYGTTPQALIDRLYATADHVNGTGNFWKHGRVDAALAVGQAPSSTTSQPPSLTPPLFCEGGTGAPPCATLPPTGGATAAPTQPGTSQSPSTQPSSSVTSPTPQSNPCIAQSSATSTQATKHKKGNFLQQFFQFLLQLIQLLLQLLGGQTPSPTPTPTPSVTPSQSPSGAPSPTSNPCPSTSPTQAVSQAPSPTTSVSHNPSPSSAPSSVSKNPSPSSPLLSPSPTANPCVSQTSVMSSKAKKHMSGRRGFIQKFLQFLLHLIELILRLLGVPIPTPTPSPTPSPSPSVTPSLAPSSSPSPTSNPCPSASPTQTVSQAPSATPVPTVFGASPTPLVTPKPTMISPSPTQPQGVQPVGVPGTWSLVFDDEFNGTSLDKTKWAPNWYGESGNMNNVTTHAANVSVSGGNLILTLANSKSGALVNTDPADAHPGFLYPVGDYAEARIFFPGSGSTIDNWPAWWASTSLADGYPSAGENDIAEGLGTLTVNYHSKSGAHNMGTVPGTWSNGFHTYGLYRQAGKADVYWDGKLVKSYSTDDNGRPQILIINIGAGEGPTVTGTAGQVKIDYVRVWKKG